jgi:putative transposase
MWNVLIGAYCLMSNHYHLLIQTPEANLSRFMRHIDGVYTQRYNRAHDCDGQLFRGRYKAILVDADAYLLQLVRYIHRNPLRLGLVDELDAHEWSSHRGYLSASKEWGWLHKDLVLSMLTLKKSQQRRAYRQFVSMEDFEEISKILGRKKHPSILGSDNFINWVKDRFYSQKQHKEIPESRALAPEIERIKEVVCKAYGVEQEDLVRIRRGAFNEPRHLAIYLTRQLRRDSLTEICREFHMSRHSSASSAIERVKAQISKDRGLRERVDSIRSMLILRQTKT